MNELFSSIDTINGIGSKRRALLKKLGINTPYDLLYHIPRSYVDYSNTRSVSEENSNQYFSVKCSLIRKIPPIIKPTLSIYKALMTDGETQFELTIFGNEYQWQEISHDKEYYAYGKLTVYNERFQFSPQNIIPATSLHLVHPVYRLTAGLTSNMLQTNVRIALTIAERELTEYMPAEILEEYSLCGLLEAINNIHFPTNYDSMNMAKKRLAFDELLTLLLSLRMLKNKNFEKTDYVMSETAGLDFPFELTTAQKNAIIQIEKDMSGGTPMNRLLQGDVGSGKTAVAAAAAYLAIKNNAQAAIMAPTEILAMQHYETFKNFIGNNANIALLTGSMTVKEKNETRKAIASGDVDIIIGTHALFQKSVEYANLGLVITDEQHRFGVAQRAALADKGRYAHRLIMSATPIPRTLGLVIYGDLDITILNELPKGRKPIQTYAVTGKMRTRVFNFIKELLDKKQQAYIVCPAIDESDDMESVIEYADYISRNDFAGYKVALLHGKLSSDEKENVMSRFKSGEINIIVATTVIEVGVDIPNATVMIIENAERFGLSQLHQLRGRIGRGTEQSYCILITDNLEESVKSRMVVMSSTSDGFKIAEEDLKTRGPGDFIGHKQHGLPQLKIADIASDMELIEMAQKCTDNILKDDSSLSNPKYHALKIETMRLIEKMED